MKTLQLQKILKNPPVQMDEAKHTYPAENGELYTGCTTISEAWGKDFLGPWYAKEMFLEATARIGEIGLALQDNPDPSGAIKILEECKGAAQRKGNKAKESGKLAHDWIEQALAVKMSGGTKIAGMPEDPEAQTSVKSFIEWANQHEISWLASEEIVGSTEYKVGGKLDAIAVVDGITYLIDFKTSSQMSESYLLQCAGYDLMLREMGLQVMGYMVLRLPKDGSPAETLTITDQTDMQFFRDTFIKQREAHRFYVYMANRFKEVKAGDRFAKMKVDAPEETKVKKDFLKDKPKKKTKVKKTKKTSKK